MIICLEEEVLPFIPNASEHMLKDCEPKDLQEFIPLISQITAKFKVCWFLNVQIITKYYCKYEFLPLEFRVDVGTPACGVGDF